MHKPVVVFALLDWGLGHTTRSIPIIRYLITLNCKVIVSCNENQKALLNEELPELEYVELKGYDLRYSTSPWKTRWKIILQIPKILIKIKKENRWLVQFLKQKSVDLVISDNRFGFYSSKIPSVFITHQLGIKTGLGRLADRMVRFLNFRFINRFSDCWIPDYSNDPHLAGSLSHPMIFPKIPIHYLGCLSRLNACTREEKELAVDIVIILSGPEPQRTLLEKKIIADTAFVNDRVLLVRGMPGNAEQLLNLPHLIIFNHLPADLLNRYLCAATYVVSRSGYTSVMDYMKTGVRPILIPTPGQAEQEYLASYLHDQQLALAIDQKVFSLREAIQLADSFHFKKIARNMEDYKLVIKEFISSIRY